MEDQRPQHPDAGKKLDDDASVPPTAPRAPPPPPPSASHSNSSRFDVASLPSTASALSNSPSPRSQMSTSAALVLRLEPSQASISAPAVELDKALLLAARDALVAEATAGVEPLSAASTAASEDAAQASRSGVKSIWRYLQSKKSRADGASNAENALEEPPGQPEEGRLPRALPASKSSGTLAELGRSRSGAPADTDAADAQDAVAGKDEATSSTHRTKDKGGRWWWSRERRDSERDSTGMRSGRGSRDAVSTFSAPGRGGLDDGLRESGYLSESTALQRKSLAKRRSARGNRSSSADAYNDLEDSESDSGAQETALAPAPRAKGSKRAALTVPSESKFGSWFWGSSFRDSHRARHSSGGAAASALVHGLPEAPSAHPIDESDIDTIGGASDTDGPPDPEPPRSSWLGLRRTASTPLWREAGRKVASMPGSMATSSRHGASGVASATDAAVGAVPEAASVQTSRDDATQGDGGSTREQSHNASWTGEELDGASKTRNRGHKRHGSMSLLFKWKKDDMLFDGDADAAAAPPHALKKGAKAERPQQPEVTPKASALSCFGISRTMSEDADDVLRHIEGLQGGATGLTNLGNTCFMNSALQCLRCTPALLQILITPDALLSIQERALAGLQPPPDASPLSQESSRAGGSMAGTATSAAADSPQSRVTPELTPRSTTAADASARADAGAGGGGAPHTSGADNTAGPPPTPSAQSSEFGAKAVRAGTGAAAQPQLPQPVAESSAHAAQSSGPSHEVSPLASSRSDATVVVSVQPRGASDVCAPPLAAYNQLLDRCGATRAQPSGMQDSQGLLPAAPLQGGTAPAGPSAVASPVACSSMDSTDIAVAATAAEVAGASATASGVASSPAAISPAASTHANNALGAAAEGTASVGDGGEAPPEAPVVPQMPAPAPATKDEVVQSLLEVMARLCVEPPEAARLPSPVAAHELYSILRRFPQGRHFCDGGQHDAQELIRMALDVLHESRNRVTVKPPYVEEREGEESPRSKADRLWAGHLARDSSPITDLFLGQLESSILCHNCKTTFHTYEPFMDISLSLTKEGKSSFFKSKALDSLDDCLRAFASEEKLDKSDAFHCAKCKAHSAATKTMRVHRFPRCLVLHIKRFKVQNKQHVKMTNSISFPVSDLRPGHIASDHCPDPEFRLRYDLYAVSSHTGSLSSGHYTAACKLKCADGTQQWFHFDDAVVTRITPERISTQDAYLLFYVRRRASECLPALTSLEKTQSLM